MVLGTIYKITNKINSNTYVGQTTQKLETRWKQHIRYAYNNSKNNNTVLARAIRKYGVTSFIIEEIVSDIPYYLLNEAEKYWISYYNTYHKGYNCTLGGDGTLGNSPWNKNKTGVYSSDTLDKMRNKRLGKSPTNLQQLQLLSKQRTGEKHQNSKLADIYCYKTNKLLFENVVLATWCKENNHNQGNLSATARGKRKHSKYLYAKYI